MRHCFLLRTQPCLFRKIFFLTVQNFQLILHLFPAQNTRLHPGHVHFAVNLIDRTFNQPERQSFHHQQFNLQNEFRR